MGKDALTASAGGACLSLPQPPLAAGYAPVPGTRPTRQLMNESAAKKEKLSIVVVVAAVS